MASKFIRNEKGEIIGSITQSINDKKHELWKAEKDEQGRTYMDPLDRYENFIDLEKAMNKLFKEPFYIEDDS